MRVIALLLLSALTAFAAWPPPSQEEAQRMFDGFVDSADEVVAESVGVSREPRGGIVHAEVWRSTSLEEVRALKKFVRLRIPPPRIEIVDGEKREMYDGFRCGCFGEFVVTLNRRGEKIVSFVVTADHIGCDKIRDDSAIWIDSTALSDFLERLRAAREAWWKSEEKKRANQALQTTSIMRSAFGKVFVFDRRLLGV